MSIDPICVPSPCTFIDLIGCDFEWCGFRKEQPMTLNNIYSAGYLLTQFAPVIFGGVPDIIENEVSNWFFRIILIIAIPYSLTFLALIITLMVIGTISIWVGILLIILLIVLVIVASFWIANDISSTASSISSQVQSDIDNNWAENSSVISHQLNTALSVNVQALACTGENTCIANNPLFPGCLPAASPFCSGCIQPSIYCGQTGTGTGSEIQLLRAQYQEERDRLTNPEDIIALNEKYIQLGAQYVPGNCTTCAGKN